MISHAQSASLKVVLSSGFGVATYPAGATFGPRHSRDWEFVWIIEGHARYRATFEDAEYNVEAPPGSLVLCQPDATDFFCWDENQRTRHAFFHFQIENLPASWPSPRQWPLMREMPNGDILRPLFRHLLTWNRRGDEELMRLTAAHMVTAWVHDQITTRDVPPQSVPEAVERAQKYLQSRLEVEPATSISLAELANAACVSREHLCRAFRDATGHTPAETMRLARLDRAATLLARSNYSVAEVARLCGFSSPFHFSRQFKNAFGQTPSQMRHAIQNGATPPVPRLLQFFQTT